LWYRFADMRRALLSRTLVVLAGLSFISASRTPAQQTLSVDKFAKAIQKEMKQRKLRIVLLVDLANTEGLITERTHWVTAEISDSLAEHSGETKFLWASSKGGAGQGETSAEDPKGIQDVGVLCEQKKCDALLLGRVQDLPAGKSVTLKIVNPQTKGVLGELSALLPMSAGEPLSWTDPNVSDAPPYAKPGERGTSIPMCRHCPDPGHSTEARSLKLLGTVVLSVVISRKGVAEKIVVVKKAGHGLDWKAIEAVREWKFEPSRDRSGNPVPVEVPVVVTFRLF